MKENNKNPILQNRKDAHIDICLNKEIETSTTGLENYYFKHNALPEISLEEIDTTTTFLKKTISAPLMISSMTGGTKRGHEINKRLAKIAQKLNIPLALGSMRIALKNPKTLKTFKLREIAPKIPIIANIGAVQLNYGITKAELIKAIEDIGADAICLHLNPLQEALQPEGDTNFKDLLKKIKTLNPFPYPIIIKEVGSGITKETAQKLKGTARYIETAGKGGTSWAAVEQERRAKILTKEFNSWGISTCQSLLEVKETNIPIIASGGIRTGIDIAKTIALGAELAGIAKPFLAPALKSEEALEEEIKKVIKELRITMFITGSKTLTELKCVKLWNSEK